MLKKLFAAIGVGSLVALGGAVAAHAEAQVVLTASPTTITMGESSTLTVTGFEDGVNAIFSISTPVLPNNEGMIEPESVIIAGGPGITTFTPNAAGTYVIDVSTPVSEGPLASVTIIVNEAPPVAPIALTASPTTITLGQTSTLTATGLEDGLNAIFAISTPVLPNNQGMIDPESVTIAGGPGITTFRPNAAGTYVIDLYTQYSESPLASVTITVLDPAAPVLPATGGEVSPWLIVSGVGALLLGAFLVARTYAARRPRDN